MSPVGAIINGLKDALAVVLEIMESATQEIDFLVPPSIFSIAGSSYATTQIAKRFIENGGVMRGITTISRTNLEETRMRLDVGEDLRHSDLNYEVFMIIGDRQKSLSAINIGTYEYTFDTPLTAFWSESPTYAEYLLTSFESAWSESAPAEKRVQELLARERQQR